MSNDKRGETQNSQNGSSPGDHGSGRLWKRCVIGIAVIGLVVLAVMLFPGDRSSQKSGTRLVYTIRRGDLQVTVTEQGTLESSNNLEIRCKVEGWSTVNWVVESGSMIEPNDVVVLLDASAKEESLSQRKIDYQRSLAELARAETVVASAKLAIPEYEEGRYASQLQTLEKDKAIAMSNLRTAQNMLDHTERMFKRGYVSELEVEAHSFTVERAQLELDVKETLIEVLEKYTKEKELEGLKGSLKAAEAALNAQQAQVDLQKQRLDKAQKQFENCIIIAKQGGMVIHPSAAEWKNAPDIEEGANVHTNQVLLMMPDLAKMQVKLGIHESMIDRIRPGLSAKITLQDLTIAGEVSQVAEVTKPAGWWTGNVVKFETIVSLDSDQELKPGMSAEVEVLMAEYKDVLMIPVAAVVESDEEYSCWVKTGEGAQRRSLQLGDNNNQFIHVKAGLKEGDEVFLNPLAFIEEAQTDALKPLDELKSPESDSTESPSESKKPVVSSPKPSAGKKNPESKPKASMPKKDGLQPRIK